MDFSLSNIPGLSPSLIVIELWAGRGCSSTVDQQPVVLDALCLHVVHIIICKRPILFISFPGFFCLGILRNFGWQLVTSFLGGKGRVRFLPSLIFSA